MSRTWIEALDAATSNLRALRDADVRLEAVREGLRQAWAAVQSVEPQSSLDSQLHWLSMIETLGAAGREFARLTGRPALAADPGLLRRGVLPDSTGTRAALSALVNAIGDALAMCRADRGGIAVLRAALGYPPAAPPG